MYRNLNAGALGISGRQSELIELALTYRFGGLDVDLPAVVKRAQTSGVEQACRFMASADLRVGQFPLPLDCTTSETAFRAGLAQLREVAAVAESLHASCCVVTVKPASDDQPYHENFEMYRTRLGAVANVLAQHDIKLGLAFLASPCHWKGHEYPFIHEADALLTLIRTIGSSHVGLVLDTWSWFVAGSSLGELRELTGEQIVSVRLADIRPEADLAKITDQDRYLPGDGGLVDGGAIVRHLSEVGYAGPVTLYPHSSRFAGMTRDAIVQQAKATFQDLWVAAGLLPGKKLEPVQPEAAPADSEPSDAVSHGAT